MTLSAVLMNWDSSDVAPRGLLSKVIVIGLSCSKLGVSREHLGLWCHLTYLLASYSVNGKLPGRLEGKGWRGGRGRDFFFLSV